MRWSRKLSVLYFGALGEQGVSFVEKKDGAINLRRVENLIQILFRFADELADDGSQIEVKEIEMQRTRQGGGGGDLRGSVGSGKDHGRAMLSKASQAGQ